MMQLQRNEPTGFSSTTPYSSPTPLLLSCFSSESPEHLINGGGGYPLVLSFTNLSYSIKINNKLAWRIIFPCGRDKITSKEPAETKVILNDISGEAKQGQILGILGPSGSGKSTLIDALANRISRGSLKGMISINGDCKLLKVISAYVTQDDLLFPMLTVEETIMFAAELRLPNKSLSKLDKKTRVQDLIHQLDLSDAARTMIGDEGHRGVSGGERRRVSIAIEIIHDPLLLFLDEPTSGLDSTSAFTVVKALNRIARTGSIVIMSIHQPSFRILGLMDELLILSHGNNVYGGSPSDLPLYMETLGHPIPSDQNPAEAILDLISDLEDCEDGINSMVDFNRTWQENRGTNTNTYRATRPLKEAINHSYSSNPGKTANPCWTEISILAKRSLLTSFRRAVVSAVRLGAAVITAFMVTSLFWHRHASPEAHLAKGSEERVRALTYIVSSLYQFYVIGSVSHFHERNIMLRELSHNVYRKHSYFLSDWLTWIPSLLSMSITYSAITFWGLGLRGGWTGFASHFAVVLSSLWAGNSLVIFVSGLVPNPRVGFLVLFLCLFYFTVFSGTHISRDDIPPYWIWLHYLSPKKYTYAALLHNEFEDPTRCFERAIEKFDVALFSGVPIELKEKVLRGFGEGLGLNIAGSTCMATGADLLKQVGATDLSKWACFWIIVAWGFFFRMLFYVTLLFSGSWIKRK